MSNKEIWRDITDPRRAEYVDDLEAGLKEPEFENLQIPEHLGPVQEKIDDHKIKRYAFEIDEYNPWFLEKSPFYGGARIGGAGMLVNYNKRGLRFNYEVNRLRLHGIIFRQHSSSELLDLFSGSGFLFV